MPSTNDDEYKADDLPRKAFLKGKGVVIVLEYHGGGRFMVLTKRDEKVFVHRDRLKFKKG